MSEQNLDLVSFLVQEKTRTQDRIRQCQIFLNDPDLADILNHSDLRESLESIRNNAEDDFGQFLHLITVINKTMTSSSGNTNTVSQSSPLSSRDANNSNMIENIGPHEGPWSGKLGSRQQGAAAVREVQEILDDFDPLEREEDLMGYHQRNENDVIAETEEERREEEDYVSGQLEGVPPAPSTNTSRFSSRSSATGGVNMSTNRNSGVVNMARSLPMTIPLPDEKDGFVPEFPPEMEQENLDSINIHDSIQQIAKSLHTNVLGELPRPPRIFSMNE